MWIIIKPIISSYILFIFNSSYYLFVIATAIGQLLYCACPRVTAFGEGGMAVSVGPAVLAFCKIEKREHEAVRSHDTLPHESQIWRWQRRRLRRSMQELLWSRFKSSYPSSFDLIRRPWSYVILFVRHLRSLSCTFLDKKIGRYCFYHANIIFWRWVTRAQGLIKMDRHFVRCMYGYLDGYIHTCGLSRVFLDGNPSSRGFMQIK